MSLIQNCPSISLTFPPWAHSLVNMTQCPDQMIMEPGSNQVTPNPNSYGIMVSMKGISFTDQADCQSYTFTSAKDIPLPLAHACIDSWPTRFTLLSLKPSKLTPRSLIRYLIWALRCTNSFYLMTIIYHHTVTNLDPRTLGHNSAWNATIVPIRQHLISTSS